MYNIQPSPTKAITPPPTSQSPTKATPPPTKAQTPPPTKATPPPTKATPPPTSFSPTSSSPTSFSPTNLLTFEQQQQQQTSSVSNCYILSTSKVECEETTNCEYITDNKGNGICQTLQVQVDNCYVLSTNYGECLLAINCQWSIDPLGQTLCSDIPGYTSSPTPVSNLCNVATKEECKSDILAQCEWDKNTGSCVVGVTLSPATTPTPTTTEITYFPTPTVFGKSQLDECTLPNISKEECKENLSCVWNKQKNVCISAEDATAPDAVGDTNVPTPTTPGETLFPTAAAGGDSVDDGSDNAGVGLLPEVDCSIFANKDVCNEDPFCFWNKAVCQDATLSPTSDTSTPPTPASYDAPVSSELCVHISCISNGVKQCCML